MSTDNVPAEPAEPTDPTEAVAAAPKSGTAKPDNGYQDITGELPAEGATTTPAGKKTAKPTMQPSNGYQDIRATEV